MVISNLYYGLRNYPTIPSLMGSQPIKLGQGSVYKKNFEYNTKPRKFVHNHWYNACIMIKETHNYKKVRKPRKI